MREIDPLSTKFTRNQHTWLVTGAAGFVGSNLCLKLLELNQKVIGLDNFLTGRRQNIDEIHHLFAKSKNWRFVEGDINDPQLLQSLLPDVQYVLHQAAVGSVPRSLNEPLLSHQNNVTGFLNLLTIAKEFPIKKIVYASSSSVYGSDPHLPKIESQVGELLSPYAATKKMNEIYAQVFHRCYKLPIVGLRYFNVFGPRQDPSGPYAAVIPLWIQALLNGDAVYINGDGSYSRDFCFIDNVIQANLLAATSDPKTNAQVYNVAFGGRTDLNQLYKYIQIALAEKLADFKMRDAIHREFREGDIPHSHADISKAQRDFGYDPAVSAEVGLKITVDYFLKTHHKGT